MKITKEISYLIGLIQTDGHLRETSRNRGSFSIELLYTDKDIIDKIAVIIPYNYHIFSRQRKTNFSDDCKTIGLTVYQKEFRDFLQSCNVPIGRKSSTVSPPIHLPKFSKIDYIRGLIDGDGSLGFSQKKYPFISFTTDSESLKHYVLTFFNEISNSNYMFHRNQRDNIYNLSFFREKAVDIVKTLYYNDHIITINRKLKKAYIIKQWKRPTTMRPLRNQKKWTPDQDLYILNHSLEDSINNLERTKQSIKTRLWRLKT